MSKLSVVYILPNYDAATATHFAHIYDLLQVLAKELNIHLIIERGQAMAGTFASVTVLKSAGALGRLAEEWRALKKLRQAGAERFYVHYSITGAMTAGLITRLWGGRAYYWNCGLPWLYAPRLQFSNFILWLRTRLPLQLAMRLATYVVTGTAGLAERYGREYGLSSLKFKILPNWISQERFKLPAGPLPDYRQNWQIPFGAKIILFVHRLSPRKGSHLLVPIIKELNDPQAIMVVAGSGPYQNQLKRDIAKAGLDNQFRLLGDVPNTEIVKLMSQAELLVMPSQEEGFPRVLLEAMAAGLPFVATDVGGVKEIVPPEALIVASGDIKALALALKQLLSNPAKRQQLIAMGREHVKQYDISRVSRMFIDLVK